MGAKNESKKCHVTEASGIVELNMKKKAIGSLTPIKLPKLIQTKIRTVKVLPYTENNENTDDCR